MLLIISQYCEGSQNSYSSGLIVFWIVLEYYVPDYIMVMEQSTCTCLDCTASVTTCCWELKMYLTHEVDLSFCIAGMLTIGLLDVLVKTVVNTNYDTFAIKYCQMPNFCDNTFNCSLWMNEWMNAFISDSRSIGPFSTLIIHSQLLVQLIAGLLSRNCKITMYRLQHDNE